MIIAISRWAGCKPNEHLAWGIALGTWILVISPYRGKSSNTRGNAFALAGRMNPIGHNTTGRCPGLCAFAPSGRHQVIADKHFLFCIIWVQRYTNSVIMPKKRERKTSPIQEEVIEAISQMLFRTLNSVLYLYNSKV